MVCAGQHGASGSAPSLTELGVARSGSLALGLCGPARFRRPAAQGARTECAPAEAPRRRCCKRSIEPASEREALRERWQCLFLALFVCVTHARLCSTHFGSKPCSVGPVRWRDAPALAEDRAMCEPRKTFNVLPFSPSPPKSIWSPSSYYRVVLVVSHCPQNLL